MIPKPARLELAQHSMGRPFELSQPYFPRQKSQGLSSPAATMPSWLLSGAARVEATTATQKKIVKRTVTAPGLHSATGL